MDYQQTLDFLFSQLPIYQRQGKIAYRADLGNIIDLCKAMGNPQNKFKSIHVAGTNGKGSVSHMLSSVLQSTGLKVGLYTSPHLKDFRERVKVNGKMIPQKGVVDFVAKHKDLIEKLDPSFFEMTVALAFSYFAGVKVDIAIIEVGLGGRLDSTNIITPQLSIITNISKDHTNLLGNTITQIATEKAGIIKSKIPVVIGERTTTTSKVFDKIASDAKAPISYASDNILLLKDKTTKLGTHQSFDVFNYGEATLSNLQLDLLGEYQAKNLKTVLYAVNILRKKKYEIPEKQLRKGLTSVRKTSGFQGRFQVLNTNPLTICDPGHNVAGIKEIIKQLDNIKYKALHFVIGMVNDKSIGEVL
ncbi:MAG: bifunctional folylpolyglutamate synthase/dihydrofolate synthase, partial [Flavobacteriales bacterium]|nr:bifunctional folylpolyglutamate synthase/dihydrofolate synthase [Flavobacteriales bacterium]